jgi:hypothetical protein
MVIRMAQGVRVERLKVKWEGVRMTGKNGGSALPAFFREKEYNGYLEAMRRLSAVAGAFVFMPVGEK